jgi:hypothetical protein
MAVRGREGGREDNSMGNRKILGEVRYLIWKGEEHHFVIMFPGFPARPSDKGRMEVKTSKSVEAVAAGL